MRLKHWGLALTVAGAMAAGGTMIVAQQAEEQLAPQKVELEAAVNQGEVLTVSSSHWTDPHLRSLSAESEPEKSIYLCAVQIIELERAQGDVGKAITWLEKLVVKVPQQNVKSAVRRLIVQLYLERGDYKSAEKEIERIVSESLLQM